MATELLKAAVNSGETIARTAAHDLESFCWVFVSMLYLRAMRDAPEGQMRSTLQREYSKIFASRSRDELLKKRYVALPSDQDQLFDNIQYLSAHIDDLGETALGISLNTCWYLVKGFQPSRSMRALPPMAAGATEDAPVMFGTSTKGTHKNLLFAFSMPERT
ncbi:hypothetical protein TRAPUB_5515 [Trametes pubescens]|uniref:Fungal-type protein kinase domain-containing protein n=1 Tax=Trametes pubescens TaxID=154538 RepID=A0A1M2V8H9_TRAPU|nr:hypothetical protein TRAPUB_5515 [Trametes pubescens]